MLAGLGDAEISLVMGGLRAGNTQPMDEKLKATLREHWQHVSDVSGLPFSEAAMVHPGFIYDTEPACRAVVAVRELTPAKSLDYFDAVQKAFYAQARDVTNGEVLADIAAAMGIPRDDFLSSWKSDLTQEATRQDFNLTQGWGISGFPTLVMEHAGKLNALTVGYTKADDLLSRMREVEGLALK